jgi:2',3'-cyclic-nucleotide 2'-phosphodiesterase (5'-nucleotidase family)
MSRLTWQDFRRLGYDAVTFGKEEFQQWDLVQQWMLEMPIPVVCTNVEQIRNGAWVPIGERYRIVEVNGVKIGIVSVMSQNQLSPATIAKFNDSLRLLPPLETTQQMVDQLRADGEAELIVLLAEIDNDSMEQYASLLRGVDVMVGGYQSRPEQAPERVGEVILNRGGPKGQLVASTQLIVAPDGRVVEYGGQNVTLAATMPTDPATLKLVEAAKNESTLLTREATRIARDSAREARAKQEGAAPGAEGAVGIDSTRPAGQENAAPGTQPAQPAAPEGTQTAPPPQPQPGQTGSRVSGGHE